MTYQWIYHTPPQFDDMILYSDGEWLIGLTFCGSMDETGKEADHKEQYIPAFHETIRWLDIYFSGKKPDFTPAYKMKNLTPFREEVVEEMKRIPYGATVTYGEIANRIAKKHGIEKMSAQAVGGAVGWNPIGIIVPCHRVMGAGGKITGYGGGIQNKIGLLALEQEVIQG